VAISFHNEGISFKLKEKNRLKKWIRECIESHQKIPGEITYIFTSNEQLRLMNREYLNHNHFTDVITFDYTEEKLISGDIFISVDQVILNADRFGADTSEEFRRVMIHGVLHLMGFADTTNAEKEEMRNLEEQALLLW
jgi:rRNA maturation RNase YbeY